MTEILFDFNFNVVIAILCAGSFLFNTLILRLRKVYLPLNSKYIMLFMVMPCLNIVMLIMNMIICCMNIGCYTVRKKKSTKATYSYHKRRVAKKVA